MKRHLNWILLIGVSAICLTIIGGINIILLNLYFNALIDLPQWYVWNGLMAAYDLFLYPSTLLTDAVIIIILLRRANTLPQEYKTEEQPDAQNTN